jgi:folate-binding protein YgfZ
MSTNDLTVVKPLHYKKTVLTSDKGRIIDLITILNFNDYSILITTENYEDRIKTHLDKYIIMDDVVIEKSGEGQSLVLLWGDDIINKVNAAENVNLSNDNFFMLSEKEYLFADDFGFEKVIYLTDGIVVTDLKTKYQDANEITNADYEKLRISLGIAEGENEFNDLINPKECGLEKYISYTKGCYIGQEVIARLDAQGKIPKQMVRVKTVQTINKGDKIFSDGKDVGFISSVCENVGLAFIRSAALEPSKEFQVNGEKIELELIFNLVKNLN